MEDGGLGLRGFLYDVHTPTTPEMILRRERLGHKEHLSMVDRCGI